MLLLLLALLLLLSACVRRPDALPGQDVPPDPAGQTGQAEAPAQTEPTPQPEPAPQPEFRFTRENFPRLDGSTSLVPLGEAAASVLLGESREEVQDLLSWHKTTNSFRYLSRGESDLLLVSEPDPEVLAELEAEGLRCEMEPICTEALVFITNEGNPVDSLTSEQLRAIYAGEITNWSEVGGADEPIVAFQRNQGAGSQVLMEKLVMGGTPMMEAPADQIPGEMGFLIESVRSYDNSANAIGYSVYYYAHDMEMAHDLKLLRVDGVVPDSESIRSGAYPFRNPYFCVIRADEPEDSPARILRDWLLSETGQRLLDREGYVPVLDWDQP